MELNLRIFNRQAQSAERDARLRLDEAHGVTIGRSPVNDLCLEDPERVVSGSHARIELRDGAVWLTDTSRNGTYMNDSADPLPPHQSVALYDGDRIGIGPFEIQVTMGEADDRRSSAAPDPFAEPGPSALPELGKGGDATDILNLLDPGGMQAEATPPARRALADDPFADAAPLDDGLSGPAPEAPEQGAPHHPTPVEQVFYRPAEPQPQPVPDDYDLLNDVWVTPASDAEPDFSAPRLEPEPPSEPAPSLESSPEEARAPAAVEPAAASMHESAPRRPEPPRARPAQRPRAPDNALEAFVAGLGGGKIADIEEPDVFLRCAGELLRMLAAGLAQTMMGRARFKSELRLGVTTIRAADNNPFKFSVDTEDLLDRLLFRPTAGFLPAEVAAREAFEDIQAHEMAMTAGLQAALRALFVRFEPAALEHRLSRRSGLDQLLPMARKAKYWDLFTETYEQLAADASKDFMRLFEDAFAQAYQEQIRRLGEVRRSR